MPGTKKRKAETPDNNGNGSNKRTGTSPESHSIPDYWKRILSQAVAHSSENAVEKPDAPAFLKLFFSSKKQPSKPDLDKLAARLEMELTTLIYNGELLKHIMDDPTIKGKINLPKLINYIKENINPVVSAKNQSRKEKLAKDPILFDLFPPAYLRHINQEPEKLAKFYQQVVSLLTPTTKKIPTSTLALAHWAIVFNQRDAFNNLVPQLVLSTDIDKQHEGQTLAATAARYGRTDILKTLFHHSVDLNTPNRHTNGNFLTPLWEAIYNGHIDTALFLVPHNKGSLDTVITYGGSQQTALQAAVMQYDLNLVTLLLENGADANCLVKDPWSPLELTALLTTQNISDLNKVEILLNIAQVLIAHDAALTPTSLIPISNFAPPGTQIQILLATHEFFEQNMATAGKIGSLQSPAVEEDSKAENLVLLAETGELFDPRLTPLREPEGDTADEKGFFFSQIATPRIPTTHPKQETNVLTHEEEEEEYLIGMELIAEEIIQWQEFRTLLEQLGFPMIDPEEHRILEESKDEEEGGPLVGPNNNSEKENLSLAELLTISMGPMFSSAQPAHDDSPEELFEGVFKP